MVVIRELERRDESRWSFSEFCAYLVAVAQSRRNLLSSESYPEVIELHNGELIRTLTAMSDITAGERVETYSVVFANMRQRRLRMTKPIRGKVSHVPGRVDFTEKMKVRLESLFQDVIVGDVHSHPPEEIVRFSVTDLLAVVGVSPSVLTGAVTGDTYLFAVRTQESAQMDDFLYLPPALLRKLLSVRKAFCYYWYGLYGFQNIEAKRGGTLPDTIGREPTALEQLWINLSIAERHSLFLYRGRRGEVLRKISYPTPPIPRCHLANTSGC